MTRVFLFLLLASLSWAQTSLSPKWEELTAAEFVKAVQQSQGVCMLPIGIIEKHGAASPARH